MTAHGVPTIADDVLATSIMSPSPICATADATCDAVLDLMVRHRVGCIPIVDAANHPIGMVSQRDVVEAVRVQRLPLRAAQLMMPLALTLGTHASIAHAATMMAIEDIHHLPIVDDVTGVVGVVSSLDVVRWLAANDGYLRTPCSTPSTERKACADGPS